ncbi:C80 family cysteine peptidase [Candidatus Regiella insecticola]|nr:C80 family cysteine peptidase [Candidatus Regiella insecticola]
MTAEERLGILPGKGLRRKYLDSINFSPFSTFSKIGSQHSWEHAHYDSGDGLSTRHPVKRDDVHSWHLPAANAILTSNTPTENRADKKSRIIVVLEDDAESLRSAMALAAKHPNDTLVYQRDLQGNMRKVFGDPATLGGDLNLLFVAHGRGGNNDAFNNHTLGGYSAAELAEVTQRVHHYLSEQHVVNGILYPSCRFRPCCYFHHHFFTSIIPYRFT